MGKTYRRDSGFPPKKDKNFKVAKHSRKYREQEFDKFDKTNKKPMEIYPEIEDEEFKWNGL